MRIKLFDKRESNGKRLNRSWNCTSRGRTSCVSREVEPLMLNLPGVHLSTAQTEAVSKMIACVAKEPSYHYPWDTLEEKLGASSTSEIIIVGYGSLLNISSAAHTLSEQSLSTCQPVIAFGARRLFNYEMPLDIDRYAAPIHSVARAALNVRITGKVDDVVNGIAVKLPPGDIPAMRKREVGYDLVPVACLRWNEFTKPPFQAHILCCFDEPREGQRHTSDKIEPHRHYYSLCREGASKFGEEFLRLWLATTYLADEITPVAQWEATEFPEVR